MSENCWRALSTQTAVVKLYNQESKIQSYLIYSNRNKENQKILSFVQSHVFAILHDNPMFQILNMMAHSAHSIITNLINS